MRSASKTGTSFFKTRHQLINEANLLRAELTSGQIPEFDVPAAVIELSSGYLDVLQDLHKELGAAYEKSLKPKTLLEYENHHERQESLHRLLTIVTSCIATGVKDLDEHDYQFIKNSRLSGANTLRVIIDFEVQKNEYLNTVKMYLSELKNQLQTCRWEIGVYDNNIHRAISEREDRPPLSPWHWVEGVPKDMLALAALMVKDLGGLNEKQLLTKLISVMKIFFNIPSSTWRHQNTNQFYRDNVLFLSKLSFLHINEQDEDNANSPYLGRKE